MFEETKDPLEDAIGTPFGKKSVAEFFPKETRIRIFTGNLTDEDTVHTVEALKTKSFHSQGYLKKPGDLVIVDYKGSFDKNGNYCVYVEYYEIPADAKMEEKNA